MQATVFHFESAMFDRRGRRFRGTYRTEFSNRDPIVFTEELQFPTEIDAPTLEVIPEAILNTITAALHLILGISYWKAYAARSIDTGSYQLSPDEAAFWTQLYTIGMGEFFYRNRLDYRDYLAFPSNPDCARQCYTHPRRPRALTGIGGGKDSVVAVELLKKADVEQAGLQVEQFGQASTTDELVAAMGIPGFKIVRRMDEQLRSLPNAYNGHIPISAVYAFIGVAAAILYDYKYVVVANEHSANEGNVDYLGSTINHQWSKTIGFERMFRSYVRRSLTPDVEYFSLLRPLSELKIVELFTRYPRYFKIFTSCNRNFRMTSRSESRTKWCGSCPKCAFAFLLLAAHLDEKTVLEIFGKNLFADTALIPVYRELAGLAGHKPFDCVGTYDEARAALAMVHAKDSFVGTPVRALYEQEIARKDREITSTAANSPQFYPEHCIPDAFLPLVLSV